MKRWMILAIAIAVGMVLSAWTGTDHEADTSTDATKAEEQEGEDVSLENADGEEVAKATLTKADNGVHVDMDVDGLSEGTHAFHVHEKGVCEPPDFESAGGHYNPTDMNHGKLDPEGPHAGDFDNIEVDENGQAHVEFTTEQISLDKGKENTLYTEDGTSLVIHADADDYKTQPAGDAGDRVACGVISE